MIGDKIKHLRKQKKMSLSEVAEQAGVAKSYLSSIERNVQTNPSILFIEKIGHVFDVSVNELIASEACDQIQQQLDEEWLKLAQEAMESGVTKEKFREFIEFNRWKNEQKQK